MKGFLPLVMLSVMVTAVPEALAASTLLQAATARPSSSPTTGTTMPVREHGPYLLSEVYEVEPCGYGPVDDETLNPDGISPNQCFRGSQQMYENVRVVPGILCLDTNDKFQINIAAFATCNEYEVGEPYVQSFRLIKRVPGSYKAPCYGDPENPPIYYQFGAKGVRTWWALKYTQPGTTFTLEVTVRCQKIGPRGRLQPTLHIDRWTWVVGVTPESFPLVIDMLHSTPLSVLEIPCIVDEGVYAELKALALELRDAIADEETSLYEKQMALMELEGYIIQQCVYTEWLFPSYLEPDNPMGFNPAKIPGNFPTTAPSTYGGSGTGNWSPYGDEEYGDGPDGGIIESFEDPCCCKLMGDVEYIGEKYGIATR